MTPRIAALLLAGLIGGGAGCSQKRETVRVITVQEPGYSNGVHMLYGATYEVVETKERFWSQRVLGQTGDVFAIKRNWMEKL